MSELMNRKEDSRATWYAHQCIASSGLAVMASSIAWQLRPDLWSGVQDCALTFRKNQAPDGVTRLMVTFEGYGPVLVLARSLDNLAKRLEWIVGRPVLDLKPAEPEAPPAAHTDFNRLAVSAKEAERMEQVHKLAKEVPPVHDCQQRRDILAARAELGLPVA